ncbi:MAG TPA: phosphocholine cytidylyltransferase family protein [Methylomirabilota bacterium]|nr:phosphocholine cytidylyltransferase family protein [Methylomirabilota bacterium]
MDALIMAAGRGSRLGAETEGRPKSLVDLGGISPLELQLDLLASRGVERVVVVTGYERGQVEAAVSARLRTPMTAAFVWNPFWSVTNVIGSAWMARKHLSDDFVYLHADTVFEPSVLDDLITSDADAALPIDVRECEPEQMKAALDGDRVLRLSKELLPAETAGEFIGVGIFRAAAVSRIVEGMDAELAAGGLASYFEAAVNRAIEAGLKVRAIPTAGRAWTEIDFPADLALARSLLPRLRP